MKESKKNFIINKINPNEFNSFEKFEMKLKESVFGVLYVLLKDDHSSLILHLVLQTIEFLQLMIFPFDEIVNFVLFSSLIHGGTAQLLKILISF